MKAVWNIVWWRRIVYLLTLFSFVALPGLANLSAQKLLPHLTVPLREHLKPILIVKTSLSKFGEEPVLFLIGLVCVAVTMLIGLSLEETIRARPREIWHARTVPEWAVDPKPTWVYKLRSNPKVIKAYRYFAWRIANDLPGGLCRHRCLDLVEISPLYDDLCDCAVVSRAIHGK